MLMLSILLRTIATIWVPSSIMRDRARMQLTNCVTAIPADILKKTLISLTTDLGSNSEEEEKY